ncbi:MAG: class I SAM-dependent methyltransferase [Kiritimatiellales bacterium]|nr:class I SAM-dependent methyltransferase [Kiritimatiellales bacterium]
MNSSSTTEKITTEISFDRFPLWQGVRDRPGGQRMYPFRLKLDEKGFIRQCSDSEVEQQIVDAYNDPGYTMPTKPPGSSTWANWLGDMYYDFAKEHAPYLQGKTMMEIGAGSLYMANRFMNEDQAGEYFIVDPSVKATPDNPHINVIREYFDLDLDTENLHPDFILSLNCIEHVADPFGFLVQANEILRSKDSRAVLIFPDIEMQFRRGDINTLCFEHINYFSEASANHLITQAGFEILKLVKKLDTLFYVLKKGRRPIHQDFQMEIDRELFEIAATNFNNGLQPILDIIKKAQIEGKTVAFHGACNGMNTLFALGDINCENILLFDSDESKAGTFVPACPVPILEATSPRYREADLVIVTAVTFFDDICSFLKSHHSITSDHIIPFCSL